MYLRGSVDADITYNFPSKCFAKTSNFQNQLTQISRLLWIVLLIGSAVGGEAVDVCRVQLRRRGVWEARLTRQCLQQRKTLHGCWSFLLESRVVEVPVWRELSTLHDLQRGHVLWNLLASKPIGEHYSRLLPLAWGWVRSDSQHFCHRIATLWTTVRGWLLLLCGTPTDPGQRSQGVRQGSSFRLPGPTCSFHSHCSAGSKYIIVTEDHLPT